VSDTSVARTHCEWCEDKIKNEIFTENTPNHSESHPYSLRVCPWISLIHNFVASVPSNVEPKFYFKRPPSHDTDGASSFDCPRGFEESELVLQDFIDGIDDVCTPGNVCDNDQGQLIKIITNVSS
jgi:hypothetical protein